MSHLNFSNCLSHLERRTVYVHTTDYTLRVVPSTVSSEHIVQLCQKTYVGAKIAWMKATRFLIVNSARQLSDRVIVCVEVAVGDAGVIHFWLGNMRLSCDMRVISINLCEVTWRLRCRSGPPNHVVVHFNYCCLRGPIDDDWLPYDDAIYIGNLLNRSVARKRCRNRGFFLFLVKCQWILPIIIDGHHFFPWISDTANNQFLLFTNKSAALLFISWAPTFVNSSLARSHVIYIRARYAQRQITRCSQLKFFWK